MDWEPQPFLSLTRKKKKPTNDGAGQKDIYGGAGYSFLTWHEFKQSTQVSRGAVIHQPLANHGLLRAPLPKAHVCEVLKGRAMSNSWLIENVYLPSILLKRHLCHLFNINNLPSFLVYDPQSTNLQTTEGS